MNAVNVLRLLAWAGVTQVFVVIIWLNIGSRHKRFTSRQIHAILAASIGLSVVLIATLAIVKNFS